ncbi:IS3 family transposase [Streptomyces sp. WAC00263]|uniref:IS3 family transposase n=1 Tax=Streptomyces sp. WAC00263 TaxID=1917422 RepID=UPI0015EF8467|nr:IS3 family transposase [Streptomyces sp. WAC00263]
MTALVDEHPHLGVECVLRELSIASSTYYRWRRAEREPCERRRQDVELTEQIKEIHADSGGIYGSPRVHAVLKREGVHVGRKRVERLMREAEIAGISPRRSAFTWPTQPPPRPLPAGLQPHHSHPPRSRPQQRSALCQLRVRRPPPRTRHASCRGIRPGRRQPCPLLIRGSRTGRWRCWTGTARRTARAECS